MAKTIFAKHRKENFKSRLLRLGCNLFPVYRRTGARVVYVSDDVKDIHVRLGLNWKTRNYVGSVFGGSIYGALDPIYMLQIIHLLGDEYIVWDKSAQIKFIKPVYKKVYSRFLISDELMNEIMAKVKAEGKYTIELPAHFQDEEGVKYAEVTKTIYIADKKFYKERKKEKEA
jgi:hypothetical protein